MSDGAGGGKELLGVAEDENLNAFGWHGESHRPRRHLHAWAPPSTEEFRHVPDGSVGDLARDLAAAEGESSTRCFL